MVPTRRSRASQVVVRDLRCDTEEEVGAVC